MTPVPAPLFVGRLISGVKFLSNGKMMVLLFGEFTSFVSAWMYANWRYCGVSCACEHCAIGFGMTVSTTWPFCVVFVGDR